MGAYRVVVAGDVSKIVVGGREFAVRVCGKFNGLPTYELSGKRGARYFTMRYANRPDQMFLMSLGLSARVSPLGDVVLNDRDGVLVVGR